MTSRATRLGSLFALLLALVPGLAGAAPPTPPTGGGNLLAKPEAASFGATVTVTVVNVDVYVTDKQGKRVTGLTKNDFEITENGRPIAITNFSTVEAGQFRREVDSADSSNENAKAVATKPEPMPEDQRLYLVVYIDNFNLQPFSRNRVMRELREFLRTRLDKEDRVMLVTYDREIHVRHKWTSDPSVIAASLQDLETLSANAVSRESERRDALERIDQSESPQEALSYARTYAQAQENDLSFSIDALRDLTTGLAGMPGRKAILYVCEGLQMIAGEDLYYAVQQKFPENTALTEAFEFDNSRRITELAAAANANRVTFYTIDAGGLRASTYGDASKQTAGQGAYIEQVYVSGLQAPLQVLAEETGGKAIINANRVLPSLQQVADDFDYFYSLGYMPAHAGDGRFYKVEVKVKGKQGYRVRHREGYRDKAPSAMMTDATMAALIHGFVTNELGIRLDFGQSKPNDQGQFLVPIRVGIPLSKVVLVPGPESNEARMVLYVAAMDKDGGTSEVQEQAIPISIPNAEIEKAKGQLYLYQISLLMRPGEHRVAIGVRDQVGAVQSFVVGQVNAGHGGGGGG